MMLSDASGSNDAVSFGDDSEDVETLPIPESIVEASFGSDVLEASSAFTPLEISDDGILGEGEHDDDSYPEESQSAAASDLDMASATSAQSEQGDPAGAETGNISDEQHTVPEERTSGGSGKRVA